MDIRDGGPTYFWGGAQRTVWLLSLSPPLQMILKRCLLQGAGSPYQLGLWTALISLRSPRNSSYQSMPVTETPLIVLPLPPNAMLLAFGTGTGSALRDAHPL